MSLAGATPGFAAARIWSSFPSLSKSRWAVARSKPASVAPPIELTAPNLTRPEIRSFSSGPSTCTPIVWPTFRSFLSAVDWSTTSSFGPGQAPCTSVRLLNCGFVGSTENPRFGAPPNAIVLPSLTSWGSRSRRRRSRPDVRQRPHLREQRLVERRLGRSVVADVECRLRRDGGVRVPVDVREDRVERLVDRVGEDERAAHRRDAEDDRDRGQRRAELPCEEPLERERGHRVAISSIVSPISCCDAPESSRTMRPSAR